MNLAAALQIFELVPPVSKAGLKSAYRDALMVWHPDRFTGNDQLRKKAEEKTYLINEAYSLLSRIPETDFPYQTSDQQSGKRPPQSSARTTTSTANDQRPRSKAAPATQPKNANGLNATAKTNSRSTKATDSNRIYTAAAWIIGAAVSFFFIYVFNQPSFRPSVNDHGSNRATETRSIESLIIKAESGDLDAQKDLGLSYQNGVGVEKDQAKGVFWFSKAAEKGHALAQHDLGVCYYLGLGVPNEPETAIKWFKLAAEQNLVDSQFNLGTCYAAGYGVAKDVIEARMWFELVAAHGDQPHLPSINLQNAIADLESEMTPVQIGEAKKRAVSFKFTEAGGPKKMQSALVEDEKTELERILLLAEAGDTESQYSLYACYSLGKYVPKDNLRAVEWLKKAAEQGHAKAQMNLGLNYSIGDILPKDSSQAIKWFRLAAEQRDADAQYQLGECFAKGDGAVQDNVEAARWYLAAAKQGNIPAQNQIGWALCNGIGISKDPDEGLFWLQKSAKLGDAEAMLNIGLYYGNAEDGAKNEAEAFKWVSKAAAKGNSSAQFLLGMYHYEGIGTPVDWNQAVIWYQRAANQGSAQAQSFLGSCYAKGEGVPHNRVLAYMWLGLAKQNGGQGAEEAFSAIEPDLTPSEITKAMNLIAGFKPTNDLTASLDATPTLLARELTMADSASDPKDSSIVSETPSREDLLRHLPTDNRLVSGSVLVDKLQAVEGRGKLTLDNGLTDDAHVKLILEGSLVASFYVQGGQHFTFDHIPDGSYRILYCTGYDWNTEKRDFTRGKNASRYDSPLVFTTRQKTEGNQIIISTDVLTLTLHKVINGNAKASDISLAEFDRY